MRAHPAEADIKAALLSELRRQRIISPKTIIANEFLIGSTGVRADLALLGDRFVAVEVKSNADTLRRLDRQLATYRAFFDDVIVVLAPRHRNRIADDLLQGAYVWTAERDGSVVAEAVKPVTSCTPSSPLTELLTQRELRRWATRCRQLAGEPQIEAAFASAFAGRFGATSAAFWRHVGRRRIKPDDLQLLSRFRGQRQAQLKLEERRAERWSHWAVGPQPIEAA